jgi:uncharacterized protein YbbC (DUF1343 family)
LWIDPVAQTAVIILTNRVHPAAGKGNVVRLRSQIATIVGSSIVRAPFPDPRVLPADTGSSSSSSPQSVVTGIEVLKREKFKRLAGRKIGLVTNHTGVDDDGTSTIDLLAKAPGGAKLIALFSPEHGIRGAVDKPVADGKDEKTGLPIYSLYGKQRRRPSKEQLAGIDLLIFDIQDIGCRFYTYITTLGYLLETAAEHKIEVMVLDRPNPIGGARVEGPVLQKKQESFVGYHSLPVRHGMTVGELALLFNGERKIGAKLQVVTIENWKREQLFDQTGLTWVSPSPNMRTLTAALLYPGVGLLETTNLSVGRGTDRPFEMIGAPWLDGRKLIAELTRAKLQGVRFMPTRFTPTSSTHAKKECGGVQIYISSDWSKFEPLPLGLAIAAALKKLYPEQWQAKRYNVLLGHTPIYEALQKGEKKSSELLQLGEMERKAFLAVVREKYLLYR